MKPETRHARAEQKWSDLYWANKALRLQIRRNERKQQKLIQVMKTNKPQKNEQ